MAYERDSDHVTRGVGAIASVDHVSPARHARRVRKGMMTRLHDRRMAAITKGALGAVSLTTKTPVSSPWGQVSKITSKPVTAAGQPWMNGVAKLLVVPPAGSGATPVQPRQPTNWVPPPDTGSQPPAVATQPPSDSGGGLAVPPTIPATPGKVVVVSSGGGGSGAAAPMKPIVAYPDPVLTAPADPGPGSDNLVRNLAIAGGVGLAAYLLFFRNRA